MPEPPVVTVDIENNEICILPYYGEDENRPDFFNILVYDITRERTFESHVSPNSSKTCISVGNILSAHSSTCTPLLVSVGALNEFGQMDTTMSVSSENDTITGDVCSCLQETGKL